MLDFIGSDNCSENRLTRLLGSLATDGPQYDFATEKENVAYDGGPKDEPYSPITPSKDFNTVIYFSYYND